MLKYKDKLETFKNKQNNTTLVIDKFYSFLRSLTVPHLKIALRSKRQPVSGNKEELIGRVKSCYQDIEECGSLFQSLGATDDNLDEIYEFL